MLRLVELKLGRLKMELHERIKKARTELHLSQEYVANYLGVKRTVIVEIESGKRAVKADIYWL